MKQLFAETVEWKPGAQELLLECRAAGVPTALVTSTPRELADLIIGHIGPDNFDLTICGDEVEERKPAPEPYRAAADKLGVDIERCVVLEDSVSGVSSALAAGAVTLAIPKRGRAARRPGGPAPRHPRRRRLGLPAHARLKPLTNRAACTSLSGWSHRATPSSKP